MSQDMTVEECHVVNAVCEARKAGREYLAKHGDRDACGFAWTTVYGVRSNSKLGKVLARYGFSKAYGGGLQLWSPDGTNTQSVSVKEHAAQVCATILREKLGVEAYAGSRLD